MDLGLEGKKALVTASSRGIGRAIAEGLATEGCQVIICSRNQDDLFKAAREIETKTAQKITALPVDLANKDSIEEFLQKIGERFGAIDILVCNAGGPPYKRHYELTDEDWQASFELTFMSQVKIAEAIIPRMKKNGSGRILFITSVAVKQPGVIIANAQRASLAVYAKTLSNELAEYNILVNTVCPSFTATGRYYQIVAEVAAKKEISRDKLLEQWRKSIPLKREASPIEVANAVVFLASEKASYITGNCLQVDGGFVKSL